MKKIISIISFVAVLFFAAVILSSCSKEGAVLTISDETIYVEVGETYRVEISAASGARISWESANPMIATVNYDGVVTGICEGETEILATSDGSAASCRVIVSAAGAKEIELNHEALSMVTGETERLKASVSPDGVIPDWSSSDEAIATVSQDGIVTAVAEGTAEIIASVGDESASCKVTVAAAPQIGDYYFSDGTWGPEVVDGKEPVAVVFYAGNPSVDDIALQSDHPECTHGLAVSLDAMSIIAWQPKAMEYGDVVGDWIELNTDFFTTSVHPIFENSSLLNKILGYNNTKAIERWNNVIDHYDYLVEAVQMTVDYRSQVTAPASSSDWFLPGVEELVLLGCGKQEGTNFGASWESIEVVNKVNESISAISKDPIETLLRPYQSSQECMEDVYTVVFAESTGMTIVNIAPKIYAISHIRFVLAF